MERQEFEALLLLMGFSKSVIDNQYYKGLNAAGKKAIVTVGDIGAKAMTRASLDHSFPDSPTYRGSYEEVAQWLKNWQS